MSDPHTPATWRWLWWPEKRVLRGDPSGILKKLGEGISHFEPNGNCHEDHYSMTPIFKGLRDMACWSPFREICGHTPQTTGGNGSEWFRYPSGNISSHGWHQSWWLSQQAYVDWVCDHHRSKTIENYMKPPRLRDLKPGNIFTGQWPCHDTGMKPGALLNGLVLISN